MAQDSWPSPSHNARAVTDVEYERIAARFSDDGIDGLPTDPAVVTAGTGLSVNLRASVYGSVRGHAWTSGTTTVNLPVAANTAGSTRIDRIVLRLDRSDWTVRAVPKQGTPGGGAPALTQTVGDTGIYEIPLARVTVLNNAAAVTVVREELYVGSRTRPCTSTTRNPNPVRGETGYETDTGRTVQWTGSAWDVIREGDSSQVVDTTVSGWKITAESVVDYKDGSVHLRMGNFERTGGTLAGATESRLPVLIPAAYRHRTRSVRALCYISGVMVGTATIYAANDQTRPGQVWLTTHPQIATGDLVLPGQVSWAVVS